MRKVRNNNFHSSNPIFLIAQGFEQMGNYSAVPGPKATRESKYDDQELRAMQRSPRKQTVRRGLFCSLLQQLVWQRVDRRV